MYRDVKTGEELKRISDWTFGNGIKTAWFEAKSGAKFTMTNKDVIYSAS